MDSTCTHNDHDARQKMIGKKVTTRFGIGVVIDYRKIDRMYEVHLGAGTCRENVAILFTADKPKLYTSPTDIANKLNSAYEALEKMRRLNLEIQCHETGIPHDKIDYDMCTACMMENRGCDSKSHFPRLQRLVDSANTASNDFDMEEQFPRLHNFFNASPATTKINSSLAPQFPRLSNFFDSTLPTEESATYDVNRSAENGERAKQLSTNIAVDGSSSQTSIPHNTGHAFPESQPTKTATANNNGTSSSFPRMRKLWNTMGSSSAVSSTSTTPAPSAITSASNFPRIRGLLNNSDSITNKEVDSCSLSSDSDKLIALPRIQKLIDQRTKANTHPCLICASPSCTTHSSANFRKEGNLTLCLKCERLFELDFIVECVTESDANTRRERIDYMIDCYDRCLLLLQYSVQFVEHIAGSLENQKEQQDRIGLASSSVGVLSGVLGIAAAASILTPAGPPLLIASLFFGGSATTVQTGNDAINYFSEPRQLADNTIALHGMALSILRVTSTLRDAMLRDHIRTDVYEADRVSVKNQMKESIEKNKTAMMVGTNLGRSISLGGVASVEAGAATAVVAGTTAAAAGEVSVVAGTVAGASVGASATGASAAAGAGAAGARSATALSRAGTAAARTIRFARFAGGALSAAVLVMEANSIQSTLQSINEGSPCLKAENLRKIAVEINDFPSTNQLDEECQAYLAALALRPSLPTPVDAKLSEESNMMELPVATCEELTIGQNNQLCAPGTIITGADCMGNLETRTCGIERQVSNVSVLGESSFFQRIRSRREEQRSLNTSSAEEVVAVAVDDDQLGESDYNLVV